MINEIYLPHEPLSFAPNQLMIKDYRFPKLNDYEKHVLYAIYDYLAKDYSSIKLDHRKLSKVNKPSFYILGSRIFAAQHKYDLSLQCAESAFHQCSENFFTTKQLALAYKYLYDFNNAQKYLLKALQIKPDDTDTKQILNKLY